MSVRAFHGGEILIDEDMKPLLKRYSWGPDSDGYPKAKVGGRHIRLHQAVIGTAPRRMVIDHINGNKLDNRRENLRFVSYRCNALNTVKRGDGIWFNKSKNRWQAQHKVNGKRYHIGTFKEKEEAQCAYREFVESAVYRQEAEDLLELLTAAEVA